MLLGFLFPKSLPPSQKFCPEHLPSMIIHLTQIFNTSNVSGTAYLRASIMSPWMSYRHCKLRTTSVRLVSALHSPSSHAPITVTSAISHPKAQARHLDSTLGSPLSLRHTCNQQSSPGKESLIAFTFSTFVHAS